MGFSSPRHPFAVQGPHSPLIPNLPLDSAQGPLQPASLCPPPTDTNTKGGLACLQLPPIASAHSSLPSFLKDKRVPMWVCPEFPGEACTDPPTPAHTDQGISIGRSAVTRASPGFGKQHRMALRLGLSLAPAAYLHSRPTVEHLAF